MIDNKRKILTYGLVFILLSSIQVSFFNHSFDVSANSTFESASTPSTRYGHRMVYLPNSSEIFMFGGEVSYLDSTLLTQSWVYSIKSDNWHAIMSEIFPSARMTHGMAFISQTNSILLFGGLDAVNTSRMDDTWEFNLETELWEKLNLDKSPSPRSDMSMYYDESLNKVFLFGGYSSTDSKLSDTWEFNIENRTWSEVNCSLIPRARYGHQMVYNSKSQEGILFGGNNNGMMNNLWTFNGSTSTWSEVSVSNPPTVRYWHCMTYVPVSNSIFVFGGRNDNVPGDSLSDTWIYSFETNTWGEISSNQSPSQRMFSFIVTDPINSTIYLFGGVKNYNENSLDDFWLFSSEIDDWQEIKESEKNTSTSLYWIGGGILLISSGIVFGYFLRRKNQKLKK